jgi:hypothetical protein
MGRGEDVYKISCLEGVGRWLGYLSVQTLLLFSKTFCVLAKL